MHVPSAVSLLAIAGIACSSQGAAPTDWSCVNAGVPNGSRIECTTLSLSVTAAYTCNDGGDYNPLCPPAGSGGDGGTVDFNPDAGTASGSGSGSGGTVDQGDGGGLGSSGSSSGGLGSSGSSSGGLGSSGSSSGGLGSSGSSSGGTMDQGDGGPSSSGGSSSSGGGNGHSSGGGNASSGGGNGPSSSGGSAGGKAISGGSGSSSGGTTDQGDGGGTGSGGGSSSGGQVCSCDASVLPTLAPGNGNGKGPPSTRNSSSPVCSCGPGGGSDAGSGPPWSCMPNPPEVDCTQPPSCTPGTHPAPCGACVPDDTTEDCQPPSEGGCWVTGGGFVVDDDGKDTFGGNAMPMKDGSVRGEWENQEHGTGGNTHGQAQYIYCRVVPGPGPGHPNGPSHQFDINQVYFGGPATVDGASGYWFDVVAEDHGEPGRQDTYQITVRQIVGNGMSGAVVFQESGTLAQGGNIQIHPPNGGHPATQSTLPPWVQLQP